MVIFTDDWSYHVGHIGILSDRMRETKMKVSKWKFKQRTVKYLGHVVSDRRRTPAESKIQAFTKFAVF